MTLPKRNSSRLTLDSASYRWMVSVRQGVLNLIVESADEPGQKLQAHFEPHDQFKRQNDGKWSFCRQGRAITPKTVALIIRHGIANGWRPLSKGTKPFQVHAWESDKIAPMATDTPDDHTPLKDIAIGQVSDLRFDLSIDSDWRKTLFDAPAFKRFPIPNDYYALSDRVRECGLRFAAFNDGWTQCGFVVFGIESIDFPDVVVYTTNNPDII